MNCRFRGKWGVLLGAFAVATLASDAGADTVIQVLRDGRPAPAVEITLIDAISGESMERGRSDGGGFVRFSDLSAGTRYQAQSLDGRHWSADFLSGERAELEIGYSGWEVAPSIAFRIGSTQQKFSSAALKASERGVSGGPAFGLLIAAPARKVIVYGVRAFAETDVEVVAIRPDGFRDGAGQTAKIKESIRWRLGVGAHVPWSIGSYTMGIEPSVHYALTSAELQLSSVANESLAMHAVDLELGLVLPIGNIRGSQFSLDLSVAGDLPVAGSATNSAGLSGEAGVGIRGSVGIRATLSGLWRD